MAKSVLAVPASLPRSRSPAPYHQAAMPDLRPQALRPALPTPPAAAGARPQSDSAAARAVSAVGIRARVAIIQAKRYFDALWARGEGHASEAIRADRRARARRLLHPFQGELLPPTQDDLVDHALHGVGRLRTGSGSRRSAGACGGTAPEHGRRRRRRTRARIAVNSDSAPRDYKCG